MDATLADMVNKGLIMIKKLPNIILMCTILYPPVEDWDFEVN